MNKNDVIKVVKVKKRGSDYWLALCKGPSSGTLRVEGYSIDWHVTDSSFSGEFIDNVDAGRNQIEDFEECVEKFKRKYS